MQVNLPFQYGTHHTKMMIFEYTDSLRVVVHTANLVPSDWYEKTQGYWISPAFPRLGMTFLNGCEKKQCRYVIRNSTDQCELIANSSSYETKSKWTSSFQIVAVFCLLFVYTLLCVFMRISDRCVKILKTQCMFDIWKISCHFCNVGYVVECDLYKWLQLHFVSALLLLSSFFFLTWVYFVLLFFFSWIIGFQYFCMEHFIWQTVLQRMERQGCWMENHQHDSNVIWWTI